MNTRRGKGYFYSMGCRDGTVFGNNLHYNYAWPVWAQYAYMDGFLGFGL